MGSQIEGNANAHEYKQMAVSMHTYEQWFAVARLFTFR